MKRNFLKKSLLCLMMSLSLIPTACGFNKNNPTDASGSHNEIADTTDNQNSIQSVTSSLSSSITSEQKKVALPSNYNTNMYEITTEGDYFFTGTLSSAITVAKNCGDVHIWLDSVTLSVADDSAITTKAGSSVVITLIGQNTIATTLGSKGKSKHAIDSKETLIINGTGTLSIISTKSAISCDKTFIGLGGTVNASAQKHCITAESIYFNGFNLNAEYCGKDILHAESDYDAVEMAPTFNYGVGFVYIENGSITSSEVLGDGIQADSFVYIKDGNFDIATTPTWNNSYVATESQEKGMYSTSSHQKVSRDSVRKGQTYAVLEESVKGIKVGEIDYYLASGTTQENEFIVDSENYTIWIDGGTFNIDTVDDSIHANSGSVLISGGNIEIKTCDDGIHADSTLKISGSADINIKESYEGIEAETIEITGGNTTIISLDDGVNSANGNLSENEQKNVCQINISGGRLDVTVNPNGDRDGIDSNGGIKITSGIVITRGPNNQNACPLDASNAISISGGTVIVIGYDSSSNGGNSWSSGRHPMGGNEGVFSTTLQKTQSSSKGLSKGDHTVSVNGTTITYNNLYNYSGKTTVYSSSTATIN